MARTHFEGTKIFGEELVGGWGLLLHESWWLVTSDEKLAFRFVPVQFRKSATPVLLFYCPVQNEEFISVERCKNVYLVHIVDVCNAVYCYQSSKYVGVW